MKRMRRLFAMLLTVTLVLALGVTGFAAGAGTGSITIKDANGVSVGGRTFNAYKLMDATFVDMSNPIAGISYTVPAELADFYASRYSLDKSAAAFNEQVVTKITAESDLFAFAKDALAAAKAAGVTPGTATAGGSATSVTINNLALGYYVIEDTAAKAPVSALMLNTVGNVTANIKSDKPAIDKKIDGATDTDPGTSDQVESNTTSIGDKVPFVLTSKVPDMTGYTKYFFVVNDTLSAGLKFNNDVVITIGGETVDPGQYTVTSNTAGDDTAVKIVFKNFIQYKAQKGDAIVITYSATVDTDAVIGNAGNPNKVNLTYSHNPNITPEGVDEPTANDVSKNITGVTPDSVTKTFVTKLEITKVDIDGNHLAGAEFELKGTRLNTVLVTGSVYTKAADGSYYKLKDGTYTTTAPETGTNDQYESTTQKYKLETKTTTITKPESIAYKGMVDSNGVLTFTGLGAGSYTLTELKAPEGYNKLTEDITVTITCKLPDDGSGNATWGAVDPATTDGSMIKLSVVNKTGAELPETGGIGTTIFYIVGIGLMTVAAVLLITKKRMSSEK